MPTRAAPALLLLLSFAGSALQPRAHAREFATLRPTTATLEVERSEASKPLCAADPSSAFCAGCTADCNDNGVEDAVDIAVGYSSDLDGNGVPDECESRR